MPTTRRLPKWLRKERYADDFAPRYREPINWPLAIVTASVSAPFVLIPVTFIVEAATR